MVTSSIQTQINNITGVSLSANNVFTGTTNQFQNTLRLDESLNLNNNALIIPNSTLQKLQYISTISSDIQTQITTNATNITTNTNSITSINTKLTDISYASSITTIANTLASSTLTFSTSINNITSTVFGYLSGVTSSIQTQLNSLSTNLATTTTSANEAKQRTTDIEFSDVGGNQTTISNKCVLDGEVVFNTDLNNITPTTFGYLANCNSNIQTQLNSKLTVIPGTIFQHIAGNLQEFFPYQYLLCNGQAVSRTEYANLYQWLGTSYGNGNGSTTFNVPNYTACFLRMAGSARTVNGVTYTPNAPNTIQQDSLEAHVHSSNLTGTYLNSSTTSGTHFPGGMSRYNTTSFPEFTGGVSSSHRTSTETKPLNHSVYFYIYC